MVLNPSNQYRYRVTVVIRQIHRAAFHAVWRQYVDRESGDKTFSHGLNTTGDRSQARSHFVASMLVTDRHLSRILSELAQRSSQTDPDWDVMTPVQKQNWLSTQKDAFLLAVRTVANVVCDLRLANELPPDADGFAASAGLRIPRAAGVP